MSTVCTPSSLATSGYLYTHFFPLPGTGTGTPGAVAEFNVTAASDVRVYLYSSDGSISYVITIDDSANAGLSTIRRGSATSPPVADSDNPGTLAGGPKSIWIRQEENLLYVGLQGQVNPFVHYEDTSPLPVTLIEFQNGASIGNAVIDYCYVYPASKISFLIIIIVIIRTLLGDTTRMFIKRIMQWKNSSVTAPVCLLSRMEPNFRLFSRTSWDIVNTTYKSQSTEQN